MAEEYRIVNSRFDTEEEFDQLVELQNEVYKERGLEFSKDRFKQWYVKNPVGRVLSFNAFAGNKMIAHYCCIPTKMIIEDKVVVGIKSMATVTHPDYRGKGLFKKLAKLTYDYAKQEGYQFVIGVANANSFPGFMKYFPFTFVSQLNVRIVLGNNIRQNGNKTFQGYWDKGLLEWRALCTKNVYHKTLNSILGQYQTFVHTYMGRFDESLLKQTNLKKASFSLKPTLYVGLGAKIDSINLKIPKFIKHSPFNLIFMDLTGGELPQITKDNVFFQLFDFDVN